MRACASHVGDVEVVHRDIADCQRHEASTTGLVAIAESLSNHSGPGTGLTLVLQPGDTQELWRMETMCTGRVDSRDQKDRRCIIARGSRATTARGDDAMEESPRMVDVGQSLARRGNNGYGWRACIHPKHCCPRCPLMQYCSKSVEGIYEIIIDWYPTRGKAMVLDCSTNRLKTVRVLYKSGCRQPAGFVKHAKVDFGRSSRI